MTAVGFERNAVEHPTWTARTLAVLGDSTSVGLGDPLPGGGWRGVGPLLGAALGAAVRNVSAPGARLADVRGTQLPEVLNTQPDAAILIAGMNDTLRSDFDPSAMRADLTHTVNSLHAAGTVVVLVRYHDHGKVFRMPESLRRALRDRIDRLNAVIDAVSAETGAPYLNLDTLPGAYQTTTWSVDRLHPSELGHRMLAKGFAEILAHKGCAIPTPVSLTCEGGLQAGPLAHVAWLIIKGIPWLWRRGQDLVPYAISIMLQARRDRLNPQTAPSAADLLTPETPDLKTT
ncbi:SGNH/GDSL hydrolase family protein [Actinokineospora auranticolor]|uniref:Lysophospholipase L1-like esterase n=1 Tax=Actinokineospora auranticolor TaxID=155976 RepID=A0A2S6GFF1_9PSEU|nr:SGNH/GDSL hydrolase family protein [Actinokineospora auranticolor]PPK63935.1 lysophospholipase L1-like esterase [Actinokineospora auranticolor]